MKKLITLLLAVALVLSLAACGGKNGSEATNTNGETRPPANTATTANWLVLNETDEFGDTVENGKNSLTTVITGNFSNTATTSSELGGIASFMLNGDKYVLGLLLREYGDSPVTYDNSDLDSGIILKTKVKDTISEYELHGTSPNGALFLLEDASYFFTKFYTDKEDIRCIVEIGSSQYNFDIEYGNFETACDEAFNIPSGDIQSEIDAIRALLAYSRHTDCYNYFSKNINNYPIVKTDELSTIIQNRWLRIEVDSQFNDWYMFEYTSEGTRTQIGRLHNGVYEPSSNEFSQGNYPYRVENDLLYTGGYLGGEDTTEFRKISDGYYLASENNTLYLFIQYNEDGTPSYNLD